MTEAELLLEILPSYARYMTEQPDSLITKFLGYVHSCLPLCTLQICVPTVYIPSSHNCLLYTSDAADE